MASTAAIDLVISLKDEASKGLDHVAEKTSFLGDALKFATGGAILGGVTKLTGAVSDFFAGGIADAHAANLVFGQTQAVITSTGGAAGVTAQQVGDMSTALSAASGKSLFGDDDITRGTNMLLTFTNITKTLPDATTAMVDLATATGTDMSGAAVQLGKALNDPTQGISALSRVGVSFTDQQKDQIKAMQEAGDMAGAQGVILAELNKEFGGSAAAAAAADGGMAQFRDTMGELGESIGQKALPLIGQFTAILNNPAVIAGIQSIADTIINGLGTAFTWLTVTAIPAITTAWSDLTQSFAEGGIGGVMQNILSIIGEWIPALQPITDYLQANFWTVWDTIASVIGIVRDGVLTFIQALQGDWVSSSGILPFHQAIGELGLFIRDTLVPSFQTFIGFVSANIQPILVGLGAALLTVVVPAFIAWAAAAATAAATTIAALAPVLLPIAAIGVAAGLLYAAWQTNFGGIRDTLTAVWGVVLPVLTSLQTWLATTIPPVISALAQLWSGTLLPAITSVWEFVQNSVFPLLGALANVWIALVKIELSALAGIWQNVLMPALSAVWSYFNDNIIPVLSSVASTLSTVLGPAVSAVAGFFGDMNTAVGGVSGAISTAIGWLDKLATSLGKIKLPDWLTPGSPTPLEYGLIGIADAAGKAARAIDPLLAAGAGSTQAPAVPGVMTDEQLHQQEAIATQLTAVWTQASTTLGVDWTTLGAIMQRTEQITLGATTNIVSYVNTAIQRIDDLIGKILSIPSIHVSTGPSQRDPGGVAPPGGPGGVPAPGGSNYHFNFYGSADGDSVVQGLRSVGLA